jgi:UrcA family protein
MKSRYTSPRILLLAGAMLFSSGAWSLPPPDDSVTTRSMTVKYDPAKVATTEGATALYGKLRQAASRVCADPSFPASRRFDDRFAHAACMKEALDGAIGHIASPMLTALHSPQLSVPDAAVAKR